MTELVFKGKEFVWNHHLAVPFRPLEMHPEKGIGPARLDGNLIVQGDNLHALKALLPMYAGKVDCIFIDPPYNTGNEGWAYNDNVNAPMIREWLDANPIGIEDGLRHDKWCAMMWPRLSEPVVRYERDAPGELLHIDIKKLGRFARTGHRITGDPQQGKSRGAGWEFVHVCVDDHSRLGFSQVLASERKEDAVAFLRAAVAWYRRLGIRVERVMTDNGSCYRSRAFARACTALGLKHIRTRPYSPKTNGKAERFIQSCLREWAYARAYQTSAQRKAELPYWLHHYNWHRPHAGINRKTPISRSGLDVNNLMRLHT